MSEAGPEWESPPWSHKLEGDRNELLDEVIGIVRNMTPLERAKVLQEFPADEVIAVASMMQDLSYD